MKFIKKYILYMALATATASMAGSLFFSNVLHFPPCVLCWYQRIAMYPLVVILAVGLIKKDKYLPFYVLPFSIAGGLIAVYHNLLYYHLLPNSVAPCEAGISCTTKFIEWFGFLTIPFLSLISFVVITVCVVLYKKINE
jgi:disulfide bond formation protein DsbB